MNELVQLGDGTLDLLGDECMLLALRELRAGPVHASDLERRVPGIAHWTARRRLHRLVQNGWASVAYEDGTAPPGLREVAPPRGRYQLTDGGHQHLLRVYDVAVHCERHWCSPPAEVRTPGLWAIKLVADGPTRSLARALADGPLLPGELGVRIPELGRATLFRRLATLIREGVLERDGAGRYAITAEARHLAMIPLYAGRCERMMQSAQTNASLSDLPGLLHMLAPLCHIQQGFIGTCHWHFDAGGVTESDMFLTVAAGHLAALAAPATSAASVVTRAEPRIWCDALLHGDVSRLRTEGDEALLAAVISALSGALHQ